MIRQLANIKYYAMCMLAAMGFYSWSGLTGHRIFGDDNEQKDGQQQGVRHSGGGHGYYYHK